MAPQQQVTQHRGSDGENYVVYLEGKLNKLVTKVRKLKLEAAYEGGRRGNLWEMRLTYRWTKEDIDCSEKVMNFCTEYLFPWLKFLKKGWIMLSKEKNHL